MKVNLIITRETQEKKVQSPLPLSNKLVLADSEGVKKSSTKMKLYSIDGTLCNKLHSTS